jgi:hypothetical protein
VLTPKPDNVAMQAQPTCTHCCWHIGFRVVLQTHDSTTQTTTHLMRMPAALCIVLCCLPAVVGSWLRHVQMRRDSLCCQHTHGMRGSASRKGLPFHCNYFGSYPCIQSSPHGHASMVSVLLYHLQFSLAAIRVILRYVARYSRLQPVGATADYVPKDNVSCMQLQRFSFSRTFITYAQ